jgi:processive 1,2-diacylglycerol beta-glucosyltransferase
MSVPLRILVLSASAGAGHVRAARALEQALHETAPDALVRNIDVLEMTNAAFRRLYGKAYLDLVHRAPHVFGYFYDILDQPSRTGGDRLRLVIERINLRRFTRFLQKEEYDLVINTHFLPAEIIASLRRAGRLRVPQVTVTTDFETHRIWVNQPCEHYFTATEEGARYLHHWGVPTSDTTATGIPIDPVFSKPRDRSYCLKRHGLSGDRPIILQLAGGFGVGPIEKLYSALLEVQRPLEIVVLAGRNPGLKARLQALPPPARHLTHVLGFTEEIDEWMAVADLVVSKPGGLSTAESLARGAPMVIVNPIPGQESRNSDYLLENGAAVKVNNVAILTYKLESLLNNPSRLIELRTNIARLARPRAAYDIVDRSLAILSRTPASSTHLS